MHQFNSQTPPHETSGLSLRVNLLGIPSISWSRKPFFLSRRQARAILYLLAYAGKPISREKLTDLLWPEKDPPAARRNFVRLLSLLRAELPQKDCLESDKTAVWLNSGRYSCDVQDFSILSKNKKVEDWKTAVSLWRGPFLSGFALESRTFDEWQQEQTYDLQRRYLETLAKLVKKLQATGETAAAISYARDYLAVDDLAESMYRALIALYAAQGERTAALQEYSRCVEILHRELGVDPLPETRSVYEAARDGALAPKPLPVPEPTWSTLPGLDMPLTGRQKAWHDLIEAYRQEQSGGAILIGGAPGVGKSRLMQEFASRQTSLVLAGTCYTGSQALFFQPLVQALRQGLVGTEQSKRLRAIWLSELSILIPELREQNPDLPPPLPLEPAQSQARLLEAITQTLRALAGESSLLLCLDDLHAADEGTLAWLNYTTRQLANSGLCLLVTYREQESENLAAWQRALSRSSLGHSIYLDSLDEQAVESLLVLAGFSGATAVEMASRLHEATGGNAYFLMETIRELLESGGLQSQPSPVPLPQTVREAVLRRANRLAPLTRQVLDMAAVLAPLLEIPLLAKTTARSDLEVASALDDLVRRQFLIGQDSGFRFLHDLTREAINLEISGWRTRLLHHRAAKVLEQQPNRPAEYTAVIAAHYKTAGDFDQAIEGYRQAAVEAQAINAFQIASGYLCSALELLPADTTYRAMREDLRERLGDCQRLGGQFEAAYGQYEKALATITDGDLLDKARLWRKMAESLWPMDRTPEAIKAAVQAAEILKPLLAENRSAAWPEWVNIHLVMAWAYYWALDLQGIKTSLAEIRSLPDEPGYLEQKQRYQVYASLADFLRRRYRLDSHIVTITRQHYEIVRNSDNLYLMAETEFRLGFVLLWSGELADAREHLENSLHTCEELAVHFLWVQNATYFMVAARLMGDVTAVTDLYPKARERTEVIGSQAYLSMVKAMGAWLAYRQGDLEKGLRQAQEVKMVFNRGAIIPFEWLARWVLLAVYLKKERFEDAVGEAKAMITRSQARLADDVNEALETAVTLWEKGDRNAVQESLDMAVHLAEEANYI